MINYKEFIPHLDNELATTIQKTPLISANNLKKQFGLQELFLKMDSVLPYSHTFKDRGAVSAISYIKQKSGTKLMCASCGNMASAMAQIAAKANIECFVILSSETNTSNKLSMKFSGAKLIEYNGRFDEVDDIISEFSNEHPDIPCINTNYMNIYMQGLKSLYYELFEDLSPKFSEVNILVPTADGTLMKALYIAYKEYQKKYEEVKFQPRFILVQPNKCAPIVKAYIQNNQIQEWKSEEPTSVLSLSVNNPKLNGNDALNAVIETNGIAISVNENSILDFCKLLNVTEGIFPDDVGGTVIGALNEICKNEKLKKLPTVCLITGNGLKTVDKYFNNDLQKAKETQDVFQFLKRIL